MPKTYKRSAVAIIKEFIVEIGALIVFIAFILVLLLDKNFSNSIITNSEVFRPNYAIIWAGVMLGIAALLILFFCLGARKKKLRSTKKKSEFAKTVDCSDKAREMAQTQTVYVPKVQSTGEQTDMPKDIDINNQYVVELYFIYEESLNI